MTASKLSACLLAVVLTATAAEASLVPFAADMTLGQALDRLEETADQILENAGDQARGTVMEVGQQSLNSIAALRAAYSDSLDETFSALSKTERQAFEDVRSSIGQAEDFEGKTTEDLERLEGKMIAALQRLPLVDDIPFVQHTSPSYFVLDGKGPIRLQVTGFNLAVGDPHLMISGERIDPTDEEDGRLLFLVPQPPQGALEASEGLLADALNATLEGTPLDSLPLWNQPPVLGELVVYQQTGWWIFGEEVPHTYRIAFFPVPPVVGAFVASIKREEEIQERVERTTQGYRCESPHGRGSDRVNVSIAPTAGWQIDPNSIRWHESYKNHGSHTMRSSSGSGFTAELSCYGWGQVKKLGVVIDAGNQGVISGHYTYTEFRPSRQQVVQPIERGILRWNADVALLDLPDETTSVSVALLPFTGELAVTLGGDRNRWLTVDFDRSTKQAVIHARTAEAALRE